ncbi:MAG: C13 family peptidase [Chloroflexota bacterium]
MTAAKFMRRLFIITMCILWVQTPQSTPLTATAQSQPTQTTFDCATVNEIPQIECEALVAIYESNGGPNWDDNTGWLGINTPCQWYGVGCSDGHIVELNLSGNPNTPFGLTGGVPSQIGNLSNLIILDLSWNELTFIPPEIGNFTNLITLDLSHNQLAEIPAGIGNLINLFYLSLSSNEMITIPVEIGNLINLSYLSLSYNQLILVPVEIGNLTNLSYFFLSYNQLTSIPIEIGNLTNLSYLSLSYNQLISIPVEISNLSALTILYLHNNQLTSIPYEIGNLSALSNLFVDNNQLNSIPTQIGSLSELSFLSLSSNQLTTVPVEIGNLSNLSYLLLDHNQLKNIPVQISSLSNLIRLDLDNNQLKTIPTQIGNLNNLSTLSLHNNQLNTIPAQIGNLTNLSYLFLHNNQLTAIPVEIGNLTNLERLYIAWNRLSHIPDVIENHQRIQSLTSWSISSFLDNGELPMQNFDWMATQTIAPPAFTVLPLPDLQGGVQLSWSPIAFQEEEGYYEVSLSTDGSTFEVYQTTTDKSTNSIVITGLAPATTYHTRIRTYTAPHYNQPNGLWSEYSDVVTAATLPHSDNYEPNDVCNQAIPLQPNGPTQIHTFDTANDNDWLIFIAPTDGIYQVDVHIPDNSPADVDLVYFTGCDTESIEQWNSPFAPGVKLDIPAHAGQQFYLHLSNMDGTVFGPDVRYEVSVRKLPDGQPTGAVIILAGRLRANDTLQANINNTAQKVYEFFQSRKLSDEDILLLSTDPNLLGHDQMATAENLRNGITQWARERVSDHHALTLYLIDHGERDLLYLDDLNQEYLYTHELDAWLNELERAVPGLHVNVVVEACHSGSFIDRMDGRSISKPNRVIVTSTSAESDAYASEHGIQFSDAFITRLYMGDHLLSAFNRATTYAQSINSYQEPWLDGDGDGNPNGFADAGIAAERYFDYASLARSSSTAIQWPPYIADAQLSTAMLNQDSTFHVEVRDDQGVADVWAVVYPPNYTPPESDGVLNDEDGLDRVPLQRRTDLGDDMYGGTYAGFDQVGEYRVVIYATDTDELVARPVVMTVAVTDTVTGGDLQRVFLPVVTR